MIALSAWLILSYTMLVDSLGLIKKEFIFAQVNPYYLSFAISILFCLLKNKLKSVDLSEMVSEALAIFLCIHVLSGDYFSALILFVVGVVLGSALT